MYQYKKHIKKVKPVFCTKKVFFSYGKTLTVTLCCQWRNGVVHHWETHCSKRCRGWYLSSYSLLPNKHIARLSKFEIFSYLHALIWYLHADRFFHRISCPNKYRVNSKSNILRFWLNLSVLKVYKSCIC